MGVNVPVSQLLYEYETLGGVSVTRDFDGELAVTGLKDWERFSLVLQKHGGFNPTNIVEFIRSGAKLNSNVIEFFEKIGVDVDLILNMTDAQAAAFGANFSLPESVDRKSVV